MLRERIGRVLGIKSNIEAKLGVDFSILVLFCFVAQHSFVIKFLAIGLLGLFHFNAVRKTSLRALPLFYVLIISIEPFKFFLLDPNYAQGHIIQFLLGMIYWFASLFLCAFIFNRVQTNDLKTTFRSVQFFTIINSLVSVGQFLHICIKEGVINPYNTGHHHPYGISSGDLIHGIFQGVHLTNVFVNVLLVLFFVSKRNLMFALIALIPVLLCGSNFGSLILLFTLFLLFVISKDRCAVFKQSIILFGLLLAFYVFVTPYNVHHTISKLNNILGRQKVVDEEYQLELDQKSIAKFNSQDTSSLNEDDKAAIERIAQRRGMKNYDFSVASGKMISYKQTMGFLKSNPKYLLFGSGIGGFSSNIAFNFSGIVDNSAMNRIFPEYQTEFFQDNHKSIYAYLKTSHVIFHSESNKPFSVYNQLLGEYGLIGFLCFLMYYLYFFIRRGEKRTYLFPMMFAVLFAFHLNYFIESLSLLLFFELFMFTSIKEKMIHEQC